MYLFNDGLEPSLYCIFSTLYLTNYIKLLYASFSFYKYYNKKFFKNQIFYSFGKIWKTAHFLLEVVTNPALTRITTLNGGPCGYRPRLIFCVQNR